MIDRSVGRITLSVAFAAVLAAGACGSGDNTTAVSDEDGTIESSDEGQEPTATPPVELVMPDVTGTQVADAIETLESIGISDHSLDEQPSLRPSGEVLAQVPSAGSDVRGQVVLTIATSLPPMPDYAGQRVGDARSELEAWGVSVVEEEILSNERPTGEVVESVPQAGGTIGSEVVLRVSVAPVVGIPSVDVAEVSSQALGQFFTQRQGPVDIDGQLYETSLYLSTESRSGDPGDLGYWEFNLGRDWEFFESAIGLLDDSDIEQAGRFRIILDGSVIWERDIEFGEVEQISINVSNGLRLRLETVSLQSGRIGLGWGNARLLGIPGEAPTGSQSDDDG
jgi:PASTA domain/NPCBM/NEW2 domain